MLFKLTGVASGPQAFGALVSFHGETEASRLPLQASIRPMLSTAGGFQEMPVNPIPLAFEMHPGEIGTWQLTRGVVYQTQ
jgi:hypothetical protein